MKNYILTFFGLLLSTIGVISFFYDFKLSKYWNDFNGFWVFSYFNKSYYKFEKYA